MQHIEKLKTFIHDIYGHHLVSLYTYGRQPLRDMSPQYVLLIVDTNDINLLKRHGSKKKPFNSTVQFYIFTEKELLNAVDVFPIEFLEMQHNKQLIYGSDVLANRHGKKSTNLRGL